MTIEQTRELLGATAGGLTTAEVELIRDRCREVAELILRAYRNRQPRAAVGLPHA